jgi:hypothetical protein
VRRDIERLSGRPVVDAMTTRALARVRKTKDGYRLDLELILDGVERRRLDADDCDTLARATALVVAVSLAPVETAAYLEQHRTEVAPDEAQPAGDLVDPLADDSFAAGNEGSRRRRRARRAPPPEPEPVPRRLWKHGFVGSFSGGLATGLVPGPTGALDIDLGWSYGPVQLRGNAFAAFPRTDGIEPGVAVTATLAGAGVHALWVPTVGPVAIEVGGGLEAGALVGQGVGQRVDGRRTRSPWAAAVLRVGLQWPPRGKIALEVRGEGLVAILRPAIELTHAEGPSEAFRMPSVGARVLVGPLLRLP